MKYGTERSQNRKQAKISLYNSDYIQWKENMPAKATLRLECKHPKSQKPQRTPKLQIHHIICMQCSLLFFP